MEQFIIQANSYLDENCSAFYHVNYVGYQKPNNPDYINTFKNTYNSYSSTKLNGAVQRLEDVLLEDLPQILRILQLPQMTVCVVPRAKAETNYHPNQLLFKTTVQNITRRLERIIDGTDYIIRYIDTKTTHLPMSTPNYTNDGRSPYRGIIEDTCNISDNVRDTDILLIDDLYTRNINIDEDAIQALLNNGARSVTLYTIGCKLV